MPIIKRQPVRAVDADDDRRCLDQAGLIARLGDVDPAARRLAARDLAQFPESVSALLARLKREDDPAVREVVLTTLTYIGNAAAVAGLVDCLHSEDAALRNEVIEAMKELPDEVAPIMGGLLADADPDVRIFAVNILESLRHPQVESWLAGVIERDPHVNVCATAVDLLGEVGSEVSRAALQGLKNRFPNEPYIRFAVDLALKRIGAD